MAALIKRLIYVLLFYVIGCRGHNSNLEVAHTDRGSFFLTVSWFGPNTKPLFEAAYATKGAAKYLESWLKIDPQFRGGALISDEEFQRIKILLNTKEFISCETAVKPSAGIQQYVITVYTSSGVEYYPAGFDKFTKHLLSNLEGALDSQAALFIKPIVKCIN